MSCMMLDDHKIMYTNILNSYCNTQDKDISFDVIKLMVSLQYLLQVQEWMVFEKNK